MRNMDRLKKLTEDWDQQQCLQYIKDYFWYESEEWLQAECRRIIEEQYQCVDDNELASHPLLADS